MFNRTTGKRLTSLLVMLTMMLNLLPSFNMISVQAIENEITIEEETTEIVEEKIEEIASEEVKENNPSIVDLQIFATTDLHGKFRNYEYARTEQVAGGLNQIATYIDKERQNNPNGTIVVDNGDTIQGNYNHLFLTEDYLNENTNPMIAAMGEIGYDAFAFGNHEFNYGMNVLNKLVDQANEKNIASLCANLYKDGERVYNPYIIKEVNGINVAIIGVVSPHITKWDADKLVGYEPTNPAEEVAKVIEEIKSNDSADLFIVSSHMGIESEYGDGDSARAIAEKNPEVTAIVAGHSHATVVEEVINGVLITQPKNNGESVAKIDLSVEKTDTEVKVVSKKATHEKMNKDSVESESVNAITQEAHDAAYADATKTIGKLVGSDLANVDEIRGIPQSFVNDEGVTDFINEVQLYYSAKNLESIGVDADSVHHVSGAAMLSSSANLKAGDITKANLANIYKFDNKLYTIKTTGKQIKKYLEWTAEFYNTFEDGDLTVSFNEDVASFKYDMLTGVKYEINISKPAGDRIENLKFNDDKKVEDNDVVYLTVNDYRYSSNLAPIFDNGEHEKVYETTNDSLSDIRDMIAEYIVNVKGGTIERSVDNNWKLTGVKYNEPLRNEVTKLINNKTIDLKLNYGIVSEALTFSEVEKQLTEKGEVEKLEELKKLLNKKIDVLSFNDLHGNVEESGKNIGIAKLATVIKDYQSKGINNDYYDVVTVTAGDSYQGTAISNLTKGAPVTDFFKYIGLEASAVGNHEFDWDRSDINKWSNEGGFPFLAANIVYKENGKPADFAKPYLIVEKDGVKIALIGIATPETATKTKPSNVADLDFIDPIEAVNKYSEIVKNEEGADAVVVLSHAGAKEVNGKIEGEAADIAAKSIGIDAVIAAHDHQFTSGFVNGVPVVQGGYNGRGLAKLTFTFNAENGLVSVEPQVELLYENVNNIKADENMIEVVNKYKEELGPILSEKVADLDTDLLHNRDAGLTKLGATVSESIRLITDVDVAITNGGGVRGDGLLAGEITVGDMYTILPFDNTLVTMEIKGSDLLKAIEHGIAPANMGWGQFAGIKVWYDENAESGKRVTSVRFNDGSKLDVNKYYTLAVNDFMATGGDGYDFTNATKIVDTNLVMRDEIMNMWKESGIPVMNNDSLVSGEDDTVDNTETPETPETPEMPEVPGGDTGNKPGQDESNSTNKPGKLPETGSPISPNSVIMFGLIILAIGVVAVSKSEKKVS